MNSLARPRPGEDEDDLLKQQEEFLKRGASSSARLVNKRKNTHKGTSTFAKTSCKREKVNVISKLDSVLGDIQERNPDYSNCSFPQTTSNGGFPDVFETDKLDHDDKSSIFLQQIPVSCGKNFKRMEHPSQVVSSEDVAINAFGNRSYILTGSDSSEIHIENIKKLSEMSIDEIKEEQKKLKESLDPKLVEFLLSHRKKSISSDCKTMEVEQDSRYNKEKAFGEAENLPLDCIKPIQHFSGNTMKSNGNTWLHMNVVEEEKLQWVGDIPPAKPVAPDHEYNARFNFEGLLMPYVVEQVDVRQALYHHGEEPERPGYTLEELFQLSRSSVLQQRIMALNTIGNILDKVKKGFYDICFNESLLIKLLDHELFLLLRYSLDDNTEIQLLATLFACRNLLCSEVDELCLDRAMGCKGSIWQPILHVIHDIPVHKEQELKETELELKDFEMLKVDVVKGALRTDIIVRIRYILEILCPSPKAVIMCLEILTRVARHSYDSALAITCCPRLLQIIIANFVPKDWSKVIGEQKPSDLQSVYNVPLVEALKLLRILACHSRKLASDLIHKYSIMDSVISYINIDPQDCTLRLREIVRLSLESFYIWQTFLTYNYAASYFKDLYPVLMRLLLFHFHSTSLNEVGSSLSCEHGTALITLIDEATRVAHYEYSYAHPTSRTLEYQHVKDFSAPLEMCLTKWLSQCGSTVDLMFPSMKLLGATFHCLASLNNFHFSHADFDVVTGLTSVEQFFESKMLPFLQSDGLKKAVSVLQNSSCLLFTGELGTKRDPLTLPSLGALMWKGESLTPVLNPKSTVPLMNGLLEFLSSSYVVHKGLDFKYIKLLLEDSGFLKYIMFIIKDASPKLASHWFTRLEVNLLAFFLKLSPIRNLQLDFVYQLACKLILLVQKDQKCIVHDVMNQIVFNKEFFKNSLIICEKMSSLQINLLNDKNDPSKQIVLNLCEELPFLWNCYKTCLNLHEDLLVNDYSKVTRVTATKKGSELLLPVDWCYLPIIHIQNKANDENRTSEESTSFVIVALKWVFLMEEMTPGFASALNEADTYCRLATVFLCGSDLFLDPFIHDLLFANFKRLMQRYKKMKFPSSFYEFYTQLLEQFAAVSYGDHLFGNFLLVPLQQRHSSDLRKQVWSEHAAVLRILSTPLSDLLFPVSELLEPCETDRSLLLTYLQCLATGTVKEKWCPVLFLVAVHHVTSFIRLHSENELAILMKSKISKLGNKELQNLLENYNKS